MLIEIFENVSEDTEDCKVKINRFLEKIVENGGEVVNVLPGTSSFVDSAYLDNGTDDRSCFSRNSYDIIVTYKEKV